MEKKDFLKLFIPDHKVGTKRTFQQAISSSQDFGKWKEGVQNLTFECQNSGRESDLA